MATGTIKQVMNNSGNGYCKMPDGTLICWKNVPVSNIACTNAYGAMFESTTAVDLGNWPEPFYSTPTMSLLFIGGTAIPESPNGFNTTKCGSVYLYRPTSATLTNAYIHVIGVGRWKA